MTQSQAELERVAAHLLSTNDLELISCKSIQSLWAGYGHICRVEARRPQGSDTSSFILKYVTPPSANTTKVGDEGHLRKILSYQVEQYFYSHLAPSMPKAISVATCIATLESETSAASTITAMMLSDLRTNFPVAGNKRSELSRVQSYAAVEWLANFHGFWWSRVRKFDHQNLCRPPLEHAKANRGSAVHDGGVWLNGGYTYLATRRSEYASLRSDSDSEWSSVLCTPIVKGRDSIGELAAALLSPSKSAADKSPIAEFETLIHGDVKSENLFTSTDGEAVAFFDFQYVGLGLGVCDLAKLFTCSVPLHMLASQKVYDLEDIAMQDGEETILRRYLSLLEHNSGKKYEWDTFIRHWETALVDWLRFQASWGFWGNTEWLEARVRYIIKDEAWKQWLLDHTR